MWTAFVILFSIATAASDIRSRRIPKWLVVLGLVAGLAFQAVYHNLPDALMGVGLAFVASVFLFWLGAIGGGDAKLMIALGAIFGLKRWLVCMAVAFIVAALMGLVQAIAAGKLKQTARNVWFLMTHLLVTGVRPHPELNVKQASAIGSPFAVATAAGSLLTMFIARMPFQ